MSALTPEHRAAAEKVADLLRGAVKTVAREADTLLVELSQHTVAIWTGDGTRGELGRWFRSSLAGWAQRIYLEGLSDGGIDGAGAGDLDEEDLAAIEGWVSSQREYIPGYVDGAAEAATGTPEERTARQRAMIARMDYWRAALAALGQLARGRAMGNPLCRWVLGSTEVHCKDCPKLSNGANHRLSWYQDRGYTPGTPGSATECGGYNCDCELRTVKGNRRMLPV